MLCEASEETSCMPSSCRRRCTVSPDCWEITRLEVIASTSTQAVKLSPISCCRLSERIAKRLSAISVTPCSGAGR